jgi:hypothetical protein
MELHLVPLARMTAVVRKECAWPVEVHVKTDQGYVCLFVSSLEKSELDDLLARNEWPVRWSVETDRGNATLNLTHIGALAVRQFLSQ